MYLHISIQNKHVCIHELNLLQLTTTIYDMFYRINAALNPTTLNNAAQALNTAALNPAALLGGKKDQVNFYIPKLPRRSVNAIEDTRCLLI